MNDSLRASTLMVLFAQSAVADQIVVLVPPSSSGWKAQCVEFDAVPTFAQTGFDDSSWPPASTPFSWSGSGCDYLGANNWPLNTDMLVRRAIYVPSPSTLRISVAIDNDVQVFLNGLPLGGWNSLEGCDSSFRYQVLANTPAAGSYLLAVRARDRGSASYLDLRVEAILSSDCNSDGIVDYGQILDGSLSDVNADGIPDVCQAPCVPSDLNNDGAVDGADLGALLAEWGPTVGQGIRADINGDGIVNGADLGTLLANWGACP